MTRTLAAQLCLRLARRLRDGDDVQHRGLIAVTLAWARARTGRHLLELALWLEAVRVFDAA